jgi:hypothetical protein
LKRRFKSTEDNIYESLSDLSIGAIGAFVFFIVVILVVNSEKTEELKNAKNTILELEQEIDQTTKTINKGESDFKKSELPKILKDVLQDEKARQLWLSVLKKTQMIKEINGDRKNINSRLNGVAHLQYDATPDTSLIQDNKKIYIDKELIISPEHFFELIDSFKFKKVKKNSDISFFTSCKREVPNWLKAELIKNNWHFFDASSGK